MKAIITQLDVGYTVSVDSGQEKRRFAFETRDAMLDYITSVFAGGERIVEINNENPENLNV